MIEWNPFCRRPPPLRILIDSLTETGTGIPNDFETTSFYSIGRKNSDISKFENIR